MLSKKQSYVRSIDIANELGFSKPSVSVAMKNLRASEHILVDDAGHITLTEAGLHVAESILERHKVLTEMLVRLGVDSEIASEDACRIEHVLSKESFDAIKAHIDRDPV